MRRRRAVVGVVASLLTAGCTGGTGSPAGADRPGPATSALDPGSTTHESSADRRLRLPPHRAAPTAPPPSPDAGADAATTVTATVAGWTLPEPLAREVAVRTATGVVVAGGLVAGDASTSRTYLLDVRTGDQTRLSNLPVAVHDAAGADLHGHVLVVGGGNDTEQATVQQLGDNLHWRVVGSLPSPRSDLAARTVDGRLTVVGGYDGQRSPAEILVSSRGHSFGTVGRLMGGVRYPAVAVVDGAMWLFGGERNGRSIDEVQRVDPQTGVSRVVGRLPHPLAHSAAVVMDGRVLLAGGRTGSGAVTPQMWWFDPSTGTFRGAGRLPYPLADTGVVRFGGVTYLLGGETPQLTDRVIRVLRR